jgi:hypothetical protein
VGTKGSRAIVSYETGLMISLPEPLTELFLDDFQEEEDEANPDFSDSSFPSSSLAARRARPSRTSTSTARSWLTPDRMAKARSRMFFLAEPWPGSQHSQENNRLSV